MNTADRMSLLNSVFHVRDQSIDAIKPRLSGREAIERKHHVSSSFNSLINLIHDLSEGDDE